jgi:hypothetical protein
MMKFLWATPGAAITERLETYDPRTITLNVTPRMVLALAFALGTTDDAMLREEGGSEAVIEAAGEMYDALDHAVTKLFGPDWSLEAMAPNPAQGDLFDE